ncbi:hypothetical protein ACIP5L_24170 [Streptomyces bacillaris]|uniref:hypothetical protein n=1 Tax=Streptomyces bacillaris TaxID=68179 RepID=UPI003824CFCF
MGGRGAAWWVAAAWADAVGPGPGPGPGPEPGLGPGPGLGLRSLAERIAVVGGVLAHGPYPSGHYTLTARFPLPGPAPDGPVVPLPV